jgi:hypothetical protein
LAKLQWKLSPFAKFFFFTNTWSKNTAALPV